MCREATMNVAQTRLLAHGRKPTMMKGSNPSVHSCCCGDRTRAPHVLSHIAGQVHQQRKLMHRLQDLSRRAMGGRARAHQERPQGPPAPR